MKKITLTLIAVFTLFTFFNASAIKPPKKDSISKHGVLAKGNIIFDVYYGFPNLWTTVLKAYYLPEATIYGMYGYENASSGSIGPTGIKAEYMINDKFGVGLDVNYATSWVKWTEPQSIYNANTGTYSDANFKVSVNRIGIEPRFYYHFINHSKFDMYASASLGYRSTSFITTTNYPDYLWAYISTTPIGYRMCAGGRVFFTDNFGFNFECGIGGALITVGLTGKF